MPVHIFLIRICRKQIPFQGLSSAPSSLFELEPKNHGQPGHKQQYNQNQHHFGPQGFQCLLDAVSEVGPLVPFYPLCCHKGDLAHGFPIQLELNGSHNVPGLNGGYQRILGEVKNLLQARLCDIRGQEGRQLLLGNKLDGILVPAILQRRLKCVRLWLQECHVRKVFKGPVIERLMVSKKAML